MPAQKKTGRPWGTARSTHATRRPRGDQLAVAEDRSTETPGPIVDDSDTFFR